MNPARCSRSVPSSLPRAARPARRCRARWRSPTSTTTASPAGASIVQEGSSMSTRNALFALSLAFAFGAGTAVAETPGLGKPINEADITAWNIDILPDGTGLPSGSGTPTQGAAIYSQKCAMCQGDDGVNPRPGYLPMVRQSVFVGIGGL